MLHVGCGTLNKQYLLGFNSPEWEEVRYDIDPAVNPDVLGTITDLSAVESESMDAVYSSHNIEHIYPFEAPAAAREFHRVLKPDGFLVITCPDLLPVCQAVVQRGLDAVVMETSVGDILPLDIFYGHMIAIAGGREYMSHKGGFTAATMSKLLFSVGFKMLHGGSRPDHFDLWFLALKSEASRERCNELGSTYLPH